MGARSKAWYRLRRRAEAARRWREPPAHAPARLSRWNVGPAALMGRREVLEATRLHTRLVLLRELSSGARPLPADWDVDRANDDALAVRATLRALVAAVLRRELGIGRRMTLELRRDDGVTQRLLVREIDLQAAGATPADWRWTLAGPGAGEDGEARGAPVSISFRHARLRRLVAGGGWVEVLPRVRCIKRPPADVRPPAMARPARPGVSRSA